MLGFSGFPAGLNEETCSQEVVAVTKVTIRFITTLNRKALRPLPCNLTPKLMLGSLLHASSQAGHARDHDVADDPRSLRNSWSWRSKRRDGSAAAGRRLLGFEVAQEKKSLNVQ